jgi:hypothetical protein
MSGAVGRFTLPAGSTVDEKAIRASIEASALQFNGIEQKERAPATTVWRYKVADLPT